MPPLALIGAVAGGAAAATGVIGGTVLAGAIGGATLGSLLGGGDKQALNQASEAQQQGIAEANSSLADAQVEAARLIAEGSFAQADATIKGAKMAAAAVLEAAQLSVDAQERFFAIADQKLEPFRKQGLAAGVEMASMLGIPNANGDIVPYDIEKLRQTPEFKFVFDTGQRAVERSAAGQKLSGSQIKAQTQFGQGLGTQVFQKQFNNLSSLYQTGAGAAGQLAQAATNTGRGIGSAYANQGNQLANISTGESSALANIAGTTSLAQASLIDSLAGNQANLALAGANNRASLYANQQNNRNSRINALIGLGGAFLGSRPNFLGGGSFGANRDLNSLIGSRSDLFG